MNLNLNQRITILVGITIGCILGSFPPWTYTFDSKLAHSECPAGYSFIASPPSRSKDIVQHGVRLDLSRLLVQWAMVIAATSAGFALSASRMDEN